MSVKPHACLEGFRLHFAEITRIDETPISQIAKDFKTSEAVIWQRIAKSDIEDDIEPVAAVMEPTNL
jgi:hypothetical protein